MRSLLVLYVALLSAGTGTVWASVIADRKDKIPNAAVAAMSGIGLLMLLIAMVLRTVLGIPTATLAGALPWFFLALSSSYTFLVWVGQPGGRSTMGLAAALTGLLALLLEGGPRPSAPWSPAMYAPLLLPPLSFGAFLGAGIAAHWYLKLAGAQPIMARRLGAVALASAALSLAAQGLALTSAPPAFQLPGPSLAVAAAVGYAFPAALGVVAMWALTSRRLHLARTNFYIAGLASGVGLLIAKGILPAPGAGL